MDVNKIQQNIIKLEETIKESRGVIIINQEHINHLYQLRKEYQDMKELNKIFNIEYIR
ncbi:MAG: hypothetical protein ACK5LC_15850 [Coprobacillaceae bacterium]